MPKIADHVPEYRELPIDLIGKRIIDFTQKDSQIFLFFEDGSSMELVTGFIAVIEVEHYDVGVFNIDMIDVSED